MQVKIESVVYPGKSLARDSGKVIFTDEGLPGEIVEVEVIKNKGNFFEGKTLMVIEASKYRVSARCDHYKTCSSYQCIDYAQQKEIKTSQIKELFSHNLQIELEDLELKCPTRIWEYRNRIQLHLVWDGNNVNFSYHVPETHNKFTPVNRCHLVSRQINIFIAELRDLLKKTKLPTLTELEIKENHKGDMLLALYLTNDAQFTALAEVITPLQKKFMLVGAVTLNLENEVFAEKNIFGSNHIEDLAGGCEFSIGAQSFFQVNREMLEVLIKDSKGIYSCQKSYTRLIDLYSGVGTFGIAFAKTAPEVICVESMKENVDYLKSNITRNNAANIRCLQADSQAWLALNSAGAHDLIIVDPPRKGLGDKMCETLLSAGNNALYYISCNPSTLIRDLKKLLPSYRIKKVTGYDFFPHTPHIEIAVLLEK